METMKRDKQLSRVIRAGMCRRTRDTLREADRHKPQMFTTAPPVTTWPCVICGYRNPMRAGSCRRCGVSNG